MNEQYYKMTMMMMIMMVVMMMVVKMMMMIFAMMMMMTSIICNRIRMRKNVLPSDCYKDYGVRDERGVLWWRWWWR